MKIGTRLQHKNTLDSSSTLSSAGCSPRTVARDVAGETSTFRYSCQADNKIPLTPLSHKYSRHASAAAGSHGKYAPGVYVSGSNDSIHKLLTMPEQL